MPSYEEFVNNGINGARNPHPYYGHFYGPIVNPNQDWEGPRVPPHAITKEHNANAPNRGVKLSQVCGRVCPIVIDPASGEQCGQCFGGMPAFYRHIRQRHCGAIQNASRTNTTAQEQVVGQNALKAYVRSGEWRDARFVWEPGSGPTGGLIGRYATEMEELAAVNPQFAAEFGTQFHRRPSTTARVKRKARELKGAQPLHDLSCQVVNGRAGEHAAPLPLPDTQHNASSDQEQMEHRLDMRSAYAQWKLTEKQPAARIEGGTPQSGKRKRGPAMANPLRATTPDTPTKARKTTRKATPGKKAPASGNSCRPATRSQTRDKSPSPPPGGNQLVDGI